MDNVSIFVPVCLIIAYCVNTDVCLKLKNVVCSVWNMLINWKCALKRSTVSECNFKRRICQFVSMCTRRISLVRRNVDKLTYALIVTQRVD